MKSKDEIYCLKRFAGRLAHDFNNVLTGVLGFAQLILMDMDENDKSYNDIKQIEDAAKKGKKLTDQLLLFSKQKELDKKPEDINKIIESSINEAKDLVGPDTVITEDLKQIPPTNIDRERIGLAIRDIIVNSSEALEDGKGTIHLTTEKEGKRVLISVLDNGKGAGPEDLPFIFEPLYRTKDSRTTGIGLTAAYETIKEHGGEIEAAAGNTEGMIFKIWLPC
ncbi:MAG: ATP-binding protein [Candidatus Omnitrophota bacterium]